MGETALPLGMYSVQWTDPIHKRELRTETQRDQFSKARDQKPESRYNKL